MDMADSRDAQAQRRDRCRIWLPARRIQRRPGERVIVYRMVSPWGRKRQERDLAAWVEFTRLPDTRHEGFQSTALAAASADQQRIYEAWPSQLYW